MPFLLVSYLPLANVENYWRFPEGILRATCATGYIFSTSSSRDKFLTVKHLSPYRHMLHLYLESFPDIFQENKSERPVT